MTSRGITAETEARETAESNSWTVATRYTDGTADVRYSRGDDTIRVVFGPSGRVKDFEHLRNQDGLSGVVVEFANGMDTGKRARLMELLVAPRAAR